MIKFNDIYKRFIVHVEAKGYLNFLPDEIYLKLMFKVKKGKKINLKNPVTFNEKLQWLKLHDRKEIYTSMVDKCEAKKYISRVVGEKYTIPTFGVWSNFEDINFDELPNEFVLKCTHDSGGVVICTDKNTFNFEDAKNKIEYSLRRNYYWFGREWPYKNVTPRIIAEKYLDEAEMNQEDPAITDYKFFCFNGIPKVMYISKDRAKNPCTDFFDMDFNHLNIRMKDPNADIIPKKPEQFDEMKMLASALSVGIPHLRVDFYLVQNKLYVGELTFYHNSGFGNVSPAEWEQQMGDWIVLPQNNN